MSIPTVLFQKISLLLTASYSIKSRKIKRNAWKRFYVTKPFQAFQCQFNIQFYAPSPLVCLVFSKFKFTINSIFTTWQAVHLYTQNAFLLVGSIPQTLRINQKSDWSTPDILYLVINDCLVLYPPNLLLLYFVTLLLLRHLNQILKSSITKT